MDGWPTRDLLSHRVRATPSATGLIDAETETTYTYAELDRAVNEALADRPTIDQSGSRPQVGIAARTTPEFAVALFATWRAGGVAVPLDTDAPTADSQARLDRLDLDLAIEVGHGGFAGADPACPVRSITAEPAEADRDADRRRAEWAPDETSLLLFTSGTTGRPKGVRLTHHNLVASATASAFRLGIQPDDRWFCPLPTDHMGGLAPIVRATLHGTAAVLEPGFDVERTGGAMADYGATGVSLVPTMLRRLLDRGWDPHDDLRFVLLGGAPAPVELIRDCEAVGVPVHPTYGTTETASQIATARHTEAFAAPDTVGSPLVTAEVTLVDPETGTPVDAGEAGEVVVDGPVVTPGYLDESATAAARGEFGLHTGDLARRDAAGRLTILGRLDDAIQTGGETVHPARVAEALESRPAVARAAVVGVPDAEWGERVVALVVPADGAAPDPSALRESLREDLAPHERPKEIALADTLPRTDTGTVDRPAVRDRFESDRSPTA
jgi:O-succinylbenzoic acid--CoA ligase